MYGIKWGKGHVHCGFCGKRGHNVTSCNEVARTYEQTHYHIRTHWADGTPLSPLQNKPWDIISNWWQLSRKKQKSWIEMKNREIRQAKRAAKKLKKKPARCSFCRKTDHRRPTCKHRKKFSKRVIKANTVWRKRFIDFIKTSGMGIGSLIEVPKSTYLWYAEVDDITSCLLVGYGMESLNVFSSYEKRGEYKTQPYFLLMESETGKEVKISFERIKSFVSSGLGHSSWYAKGIKVLSPTLWNPPDGWAESSDNVELDYVLNKLSMTSSEFPLIYTFIDTWAKDKKDE